MARDWCPSQPEDDDMARDWCPSRPELDDMARDWCPSRPELDIKARDWCPRQPKLVHGKLDSVIVVQHQLLGRQTAQNDVDLSILEFDVLPRQVSTGLQQFFDQAKLVSLCVAA